MARHVGPWTLENSQVIFGVTSKMRAATYAVMLVSQICHTLMENLAQAYRFKIGPFLLRMCAWILSQGRFFEPVHALMFLGSSSPGRKTPCHSLEQVIFISAFELCFADWQISRFSRTWSGSFPSVLQCQPCVSSQDVLTGNPSNIFAPSSCWCVLGGHVGASTVW